MRELTALTFNIAAAAWVIKGSVQIPTLTPSPDTDCFSEVTNGLHPECPSRLRHGALRLTRAEHPQRQAQAAESWHGCPEWSSREAPRTGAPVILSQR